MREVSKSTKLFQAGFVDAARAETLLADNVFSAFDEEWLIARFAKVADPDLGLLHFLRLLEAVQNSGEDVARQLEKLLAMEAAVEKLFAVLGYSTALAEILIAGPENISVFFAAGTMNGCDTKIPDNSVLQTTLEQKQQEFLAVLHESLQAGDDFQSTVTALRKEYWAQIIQIAAIDLTAENPIALQPQVSAAISDVVGGILDAGIELARTQVQDGANVDLAVIAMGKTGARELNYISDVDVMYVAKSAHPDFSDSEILPLATQMAQILARIVFASGQLPALWELDPNLRPEGKDGPLVRTLNSYQDYYQRWAETWEFQALLKARTVAGSVAFGAAFLEMTSTFVWQASAKPDFVENVQAMRERVTSLIPAKEISRQLKLGRGGLRDVEFTMQLLQLVHGRTDESLRVAGTQEAISALSAGGYISRSSKDDFSQAYAFLRTLEHRIQLQRFKRTHLIPENPVELRRIARSLKYEGVRNPDDLEAEIRRVSAFVVREHNSVFYRPLLPAVAKLSADDVSLEPEAAKARLAALGYRDPQGALKHIEALTAGFSRTAAIQRQILPVMLGWFGKCPEPDEGLKAFRIISETMGGTSWYMRTLRDSGLAAQRLAKVLANSKYIAQWLPKLPEAISWIDDAEALKPRTFDSLLSELESLLSRRDSVTEIVTAGRYLRRKELLRTALAQALGLLEQEEVSQAISNAAHIALEAGYRGAMLQVCVQRNLIEPLAEVAVIGMGRFGGAELSYASDADVIFVHQGDDGFALDFAKAFTSLLRETSAEPSLEVDASLRPEGKNGPLSRSLAGIAEYYAKWADTWERQALLRARYAVGNKEIGAAFIELINPIRYPKDFSQAQAREIRAMKARVEAERMPQGVDPRFHLKLGRGGIADVEWLVQLLQLQFAGKYETLQVTQTQIALQEFARLGLISAQEAAALSEAWAFASKLRDLNVLGTGRTNAVKVDVLSQKAEELKVLAALSGESARHWQELRDEYLRTARKSRAVFERYFFGD